MVLLHFKQLTSSSCSPGALLARPRSPGKLPPEPTSHLIPGAAKPRKARTQLECPWPWACAWSACSRALIPEQPGVSSNHRQRAESEGGCCGKEGELSNVAGAPREGTDGQTAESAVGCGLLVCSWWNWCFGLRSEKCRVLCHSLTPFPYPRAFWTQLPGEQWDRTRGCPCYEGSDSQEIPAYPYYIILFCFSK